MLTVKGDSMINAGIFNGDNIIVSKQNSAHNGEIIVALVDDSATVKRFYKEEGHIRLQPENDTMEPIIVSDCEILGKSNWTYSIKYRLTITIFFLNVMKLLYKYQKTLYWVYYHHSVECLCFYINIFIVYEKKNQLPQESILH